MSRATQGYATLRIASCTSLSLSMERLSKRFHSLYFMRSRGPTTPKRPKPLGFGLFPVRSPLLRESLLFSLPTGTKMFQFPAFASSIRKIPESLPVGCPIRKSTHQRPFAPPRGLSQLIASFIACKSLGIHRTPFRTCYHRPKAVSAGNRESYSKILRRLIVVYYLYAFSYLEVSQVLHDCNPRHLLVG